MGEEKSDIGMTVQNITPELARSFNVQPSEGVLVVDVKSNSPADKAGMQRGDVILEVNRKKIGDTRDFQKAIKASQDDTLLFLISRGDHILYIAIGR
jgi:serine protease Do